MVGALLVAGVIAFFTGGAGLALAVDIIVKAMIVIFGAVAIYRAMGFIWEYVKKAWAGDYVGASALITKYLCVVFVFIFSLWKSKIFSIAIATVKILGEPESKKKRENSEGV